MSRKKKPKKRIRPRGPLLPPNRKHKSIKDYKRKKKVTYRDPHEAE